MIIRLSVCTVRNFMVNTYVHKYVCMYFKIKLYVFILGVNSNYAVNGRSRQLYQFAIYSKDVKFDCCSSCCHSQAQQLPAVLLLLLLPVCTVLVLAEQRLQACLH